MVTGVIYPGRGDGQSRRSRSPRRRRAASCRRTARPSARDCIGQAFSDPRYFWGRPSATAPQPYNGLASAGSNQGPLNPALTDAVKCAGRRTARGGSRQHSDPVPVDLVTASGSGLDPQISPARRQLSGGTRRACARAQARGGEGLDRLTHAGEVSSVSSVNRASTCWS